MKRERLGKDPFEGSAIGCDFEANFARMESERESKRELKSLDTQFQPRQHRGRFCGELPIWPFAR
jgi:hypothetical protein